MFYSQNANSKSAEFLLFFHRSGRCFTNRHYCFCRVCCHVEVICQETQLFRRRKPGLLPWKLGFVTGILDRSWWHTASPTRHLPSSTVSSPAPLSQGRWCKRTLVERHRCCRRCNVCNVVVGRLLVLFLVFCCWW